MNKRITKILIIMLGLLLILSSVAFSDRAIRVRSKHKRLALVFGNGDYQLAPLKNPVNDARDIARLLRKFKFEVIHKENASQKVMEEAIRTFGKKLRKGGVGLFYFAGHGVQLKGRNYLIPVGAKIESESDVRYESVDAGRVLGKMENAENDLNVIILDACRNNPFARSFRSQEQGLAKMDAPMGSLIAYATAPGSVAADGKGKNGIFTNHFLKYAQEPGLTVERVLKKTRIAVVDETNKKQVPWESSSLRGDFYFVASGTATVYESGPSALSQKGLLSVSSNVSSVEVYIDGRYVGATPIKRKEISPGSHRIIAKKPGYRTYKQNVDVNRGRLASIDVYFSKDTPQTSRLYVDTEPADARIKILNITPNFFQGITLTPGRSHVYVGADGFEPEKRWIELEAGEDKRLNIPLQKKLSDNSIQTTITGRKITNSLGMEFVHLSSLSMALNVLTRNIFQES